MKSPFPGMDPYLEQFWGDVHSSLAIYAKDQLQSQLPSDLVARVEEHISVESDDPTFADSHGYYPDVRVEEFSNGSAAPVESGNAVAVADSIEVLRDAEPFTQRSIRIVDTSSGNRIVTAIEFLSPANKVGDRGRKAYAKKRMELLAGGVSLVEIDLLRAGEENMPVSLKNVPAEYREPYRICVVRAWRWDRAQVYRTSLRAKLPTISVPLRPSDKEISLDLQSLIEQVYSNGRYERTDYRKDPVPVLSPDDAKWADQLLREKGLR